MSEREREVLFAAGVAHELRTPLATLQGFCSELQSACDELRLLLSDPAIPPAPRARAEVLLDQDVAESLHCIQSSVTHMDQVVQALLRFARASCAGECCEPIDMQQLVSRLVARHELKAREHGTQVELLPLSPVWGDPVGLETVFGNLLFNAIQYRDENRPGRIQVGEIPAESAESPGWRTYFVRDNGRGIPASQREEIFRLFQRLHPEERGGEGLGLAIARQITDRHGGRIWVESTPGLGATFYVRLPDGPAVSGSRE